MKLVKLLVGILLLASSVQAQYKADNPNRWKIDRNKLISGGLLFTAGAAKGFNETLMFHWKGFNHMFKKANPNWYNPNVSWRNKYKGGDPYAGAKYPLSTTVLVMFTDQ